MFSQTICRLRGKWSSVKYFIKDSASNITTVEMKSFHGREITLKIFWILQRHWLVTQKKWYI